MPVIACGMVVSNRHDEHGIVVWEVVNHLLEAFPRTERDVCDVYFHAVALAYAPLIVHVRVEAKLRDAELSLKQPTDFGKRQVRLKEPTIFHRRSFRATAG